jgi:hypothetical protein
VKFENFIAVANLAILCKTGEESFFKTMSCVFFFFFLFFFFLAEAQYHIGNMDIYSFGNYDFKNKYDSVFNFFQK